MPGSAAELNAPSKKSVEKNRKKSYESSKQANKSTINQPVSRGF